MNGDGVRACVRVLAGRLACRRRGHHARAGTIGAIKRRRKNGSKALND